MVKVEIRNLRKVFSSDSRRTAPIDGLSLEMPAGGITAVIGRSGCGKTTLLRLLAGLEKPDSGEIRMEDAQGRAAAPRTAVVFQEHRLFPWMSVRRNVEVAVRHLPADERRAKVDAVLALTGLAHASESMPAALSGGMSQRVMIAMAIACRPKLLSRICRLENGVIARTYDNPAPYPRSLATPGLGALSEEILRGFLEEEPLL